MGQSKTELLIDSYLEWYKSTITLKQLKSADQIITPYLNHLNDRISIFIEFLDNNSIKLSDDGVTFNELELMSLNISTDVRKSLINDIIRKYGLFLENGILYNVSENVKDFPQKKHNLIQGILSLYDLLLTNKSNVKGLFKEEVLTFLFENEFGGNASVKFTGSSGIDYLIDYSLGATKRRPNILFKFQNHPNFSNVTEQKFIADDLKNDPTLKLHGIKYVMITGDNTIQEKVSQAAGVSGIDIIPFENKNEILALKS